MAACAAVARAHGVAVDEPRVLRDATNVVVHLAPAPVVARVSMTLGPTRGLRSLEDEVAFAIHAVAGGARVVPPASLLPPGPHSSDGFEMTFWDHVETDGEVDARAAGRELRTLHDAVADFERELPAFDRLDEAEALVDGLEPASFADAEDLTALRRALAVVRERLAGIDLTMRPLHGDSHLGNVLQTASGPVWSDLENVCAGPPEYDVACLAWRERVHGMPVGEALAGYGPYDAGLVEALMPALGVFLAAWTIVIVRRRPSLASAKYGEERLRYVHELARG